MKILEVIPNFESGGAERFVFELSKSLKEKGECCDVITLFDVPEDNEMLKELKKNGIKVYQLHKKTGLDLKLFVKLVIFIIKGKYDAVHAHVGAIKYLFLATIICYKVCFFATIHSEARREAGKTIDLWTRKFMFKYGYCIPIAISEESEKSFVEFYGHPVKTIRNGVSDYVTKDKINLRENDDQIVFLHPARCHVVKNQELLIKAFSKLVDVVPNVKLIWIGNTESSKDLFESLVPFMPNQIVCKGEVINVRDYMAEADAMCLSSKMEGMPITIIEAFSVGCIPLCTPVGGCKNMIQDGENGFLSDDLTVEAYYLKLKQFCELQPEEKQTIKQKAKESFSNYTIDECSHHYIELFNKSSR